MSVQKLVFKFNKNKHTLQRKKILSVIKIIFMVNWIVLFERAKSVQLTLDRIASYHPNWCGSKDMNIFVRQHIATNCCYFFTVEVILFTKTNESIS